MQFEIEGLEELNEQEKKAYNTALTNEKNKKDYNEAGRK